MNWKELSRPEKNALQSLYGGGSLRNYEAVVKLRLRELGLVEGNDGDERLSALGWDFLGTTHAQMKARIRGLARGADASEHKIA